MGSGTSFDMKMYLISYQVNHETHHSILRLTKILFVSMSPEPIGRL